MTGVIDAVYSHPLVTFATVGLVRTLMALCSIVADCDEVFNYWEATHYLNHFFGKQTWEYSPEFAIRSWAYASLYSLVDLVGEFLRSNVPGSSMLEGFIFRSVDLPVSEINHNITAFYTVRIALALWTAYTEVRLYYVLRNNVSWNVARYYLWFSVLATGMYHASSAYLPSAFSMNFATLAIGNAITFISLHSKGPLTLFITLPNKYAVWAVAQFWLGGCLGWPFAWAVALPFLAYVVLLPFSIAAQEVNVSLEEKEVTVTESIQVSMDVEEDGFGSNHTVGSEIIIEDLETKLRSMKIDQGFSNNGKRQAEDSDNQSFEIGFSSCFWRYISVFRQVVVPISLSGMVVVLLSGLGMVAIDRRFYRMDSVDELRGIVNGTSITGLRSFAQRVIEIIRSKVLFVPLNIVYYNVFNNGERDVKVGPEIFGTEPWFYYALNLLLNFNVVFILALVSPLLILVRAFGKSIDSLPKTLGPTSLTFILAPFFLWGVIFVPQAHKEERFFYPVYASICLNAAFVAPALIAATSQVLRVFFSGILLSFSRANRLFKRWNITGKLSSLLLLAYSVVSLSRTASLYMYYSGPVEIYKHIPGNATGNLCLGREWYHYPSSYFIPDTMRLKFIASGFDGLLPGDFMEIEEEDIGYLLEGRRQRVDSTSISTFADIIEALVAQYYLPGTYTVPKGMNNRNEFDPGKLVPFEMCDYAIEVDIPVSTADGEVDIFALADLERSLHEQQVPFESLEAGMAQEIREEDLSEYNENFGQELGNDEPIDTNGSSSNDLNDSIDDPEAPKRNSDIIRTEWEKLACTKFIDNANSGFGKLLYVPAVFRKYIPQSEVVYNDYCLFRRRTD